MGRGETITGTAAGVPFTALPPDAGADAAAPLLVTWHMLDAPRTDAAFAAALPMVGVPAWRVHLGMPMCGRRMPDGGMAAAFEIVRTDPMLAYVEPFVRQAVEEFPAALAEVRERLPVDDGPIGVLGGSLGGAVALCVLAERPVPVAAAALVNPAVRARSVVGLVEGLIGRPYAWTEQARAAADRLDFVARADDIAARPPQPPLLLVSGELDHPELRADAADLVAAVRSRYTAPDTVASLTIPGLAHPLAEEPGLEPLPGLPAASAVDKALTDWFLTHLGGAER
jgi:dienelactone hydrolase